MSRTRGKCEDRLAELLALQRIAQPQIQRVLRHADGARRRLDARGFEGLHQLLEALAFLAAQQIGGRHFEAVEADLVFLHAAIAEHADLAAAHALGGKRIAHRCRAASRPGTSKARDSPSCRGSVRTSKVITSARAAWVIQVLLPEIGRRRPRARRGFAGAEIGTGVGLGEHRRRQFLAAGDQRQPMLALLLRAAGQDQFGRDLRARAERAHADIAARQFLGHHAHRGLGQARAAIFLRNREAEHAQRAHFRDHVERNQFVLQMPLMREGRDLSCAKRKNCSRIMPIVSSRPGSPMNIAPACCAR